MSVCHQKIPQVWRAESSEQSVIKKWLQKIITVTTSNTRQTSVFAITESSATSLQSPAPAPAPVQPTTSPSSMALAMMLPPTMVPPGNVYNGAAYNGPPYDGTSHLRQWGFLWLHLPSKAPPAPPRASAAVGPLQPSLNHDEKLIKRVPFWGDIKMNGRFVFVCFFPFPLS